MKGREMFEELGFKLSTTNEWQSTFLHADNKGQLFVGFHNTDKSVTVDYFVQRGGPIQERNQSKLSMNLLSAIYKYCKELGWIEEEKKEIKQETNLDHYKDDIAELFIDKLALVDGKPERCKRVIICDNCDLYEKCNEYKAQEELRKWLKQPYKKPACKLTQFEYDLLQNYNGRLRFINMNTLYCMKEKGYFKGIDENETVGDILANCEVIK
jgi:hypothetical protein